ncbi:L-threonylcarbamoyladenylate synthase [Desulfurobacterium sp.]
MKTLTFENDFKLIKQLILSGEVICSPTDTQYGLIGSALDKTAIEKVYALKKRDPDKPLIILFDTLESIKKYGILVPEKIETQLNKIWPARLTVILPVKRESPFEKIFKRRNIAVRIPAFAPLRRLISETTPIFAPSANIQGKKPAENCRECRSYFNSRLTYCIKGKTIPLPSTLLSLTGNTPEILREGAVPVSILRKYFPEARIKK